MAHRSQVGAGVLSAFAVLTRPQTCVHSGTGVLQQWSTGHDADVLIPVITPATRQSGRFLQAFCLLLYVVICT
jgi:hypothetical protein